MTTYPFPSALLFGIKHTPLVTILPHLQSRHPFSTGAKFKIPLQECLIKQDLSTLQFWLLILLPDVLVYYNCLFNP
jgi:hypothetical protein